MAENGNGMEAVHKLLAGGFSENGWAGLESGDTRTNEERQQEMAQTRYDNAQIVAGPFASAAGRKSLAKLKAMTIEQPGWNAENKDFHSAAAYGFVREGQNSIVRYIEDCLRILEEGPPVLAKPVQKKRRTPEIPTH